MTKLNISEKELIDEVINNENLLKFFNGKKLKKVSL